MKAVGNKITFALYFGNRGIFPRRGYCKRKRGNEKSRVGRRLRVHMHGRRKNKVRRGLKQLREGEKYAQFLEENRGSFDGVFCACRISEMKTVRRLL